MEHAIFILPFDHRKTFVTDILGLSGDVNGEQIKQISDLKRMIFDAFLTVRKSHGNSPSFAILIDELFCSSIIPEVRERGIPFAVAVEKSGQSVFDFEYGEGFADHIDRVNPTYVKVLVRYHPADREANQIQLTRLARLSVYCRSRGHRLLFELLVPPSNDDLVKTGSVETYDEMLRPQYMREAIVEIAQSVHVDLWKLEGVGRNAWPDLIKVIPDGTPIVVLGRGADRDRVTHWLDAASGFSSIIGFAVGRTIFLSPLISYCRKNISRSDAIAAMATEYETLVAHWLNQKGGPHEG